MTPPRLLDADDARLLGRLAVYSLLLIWVILVLSLACGLAARVFLLAKGG